MIPVERLKTIPLFAGLDDEELAHLAPLFHRTRCNLADIVSRQGDPGNAFYVLDAGVLRVRYVDAQEQETVLGYLSAPAFFGETSLMTGMHRDVTIDVYSNQADLLVLPKHEFDILLTQYPELRQHLTVRPEVEDRLGQKLYPWLSPGELVLVNTRRHWYALVARLILPLFISMLLMVLAFVLFSAQPILGGSAADILMVLSLGLLVLAFLWTIGSAAWLALDWSNDFYIVTNKRVIHVEQVPFLLNAREEAPIEMVTNVSESSSGVAARTFGFANLHVETAGREVDVTFTYAPTALGIPRVIFDQIDRVRDRAAFERRERMRAGMRDELWNRLAPEQAQAHMAAEQAALAMSPEPEPVDALPLRHAENTGLAQRLNALFGLKVEAPHQVTWRKHWFVLIEQIAQPLVACWLVLTVGVLNVSGVIPIRVLGSAVDLVEIKLLLSGIWGILLASAGFWLWYQYEDWSNDVYRVTDDRVIDLERTPFGLHTRSIETTLDRVQDVSYRQRSPMALLFNYGDVFIETAGAGRFTFHGVLDPRGATQEIFRRWDAHRSVQVRDQAQHERREFLDWFMEYHRLLQEQGEIRAPEEPSMASDQDAASQDQPQSTE